MTRTFTALILAALVCLGGAVAYSQEAGPPAAASTSAGDELLVVSELAGASAAPTAAAVLIPAPAPAAALADPAADPSAFAQVVLGAARARRWGFVAVLGVLALLALLRKLGGRLWSGFATDTGGAALACGFALLMPLALVLSTGASLTWPLYVGTVLATAAASGLYAWARKLGRALLLRLAPPAAGK